MQIAHRIITNSQGAKLRFMAFQNVNVYQYTLCALFPNNNWQRIYVSRLYDNDIIFWSEFFKTIKSFKTMKFDKLSLAISAIGKYGQPKVINFR